VFPCVSEQHGTLMYRDRVQPNALRHDGVCHMLDQLFGSKVRAAILTALLERPSEPVHLRELVRRAGGSISGVQREITRLEQLGLVVSRRDHAGLRQVSIVREHPLADPLTGLVAAESRASYATLAAPVSERAEPVDRLNPRVRGLVAPVVETCLAFGATRVALFGSATQVDAAVVPADLDVSVRFEPDDARSQAERYFGLKAALQRVTGMRVDLREAESGDNPYLQREIEATEVVLYEAP
jgi:predicted nucleotidyltransferase/DNA-binding transcriptional ArsR family regulator